MNEFRHTEQHSDNLQERLMELVEIDKDWQTPERRKAIQHEVACIIFEQIQRYAETHPEQATINTEVFEAQL